MHAPARGFVSRVCSHGQGRHCFLRFVLKLHDGSSPMSADFVHAALGMLFASVWLMVGQIVASDR